MLMLAFIRQKSKQWKAYKKKLTGSKTWLLSLIDLIESLLIALVIVLIFRRIAIQTSLIPTPSMVPTLQVKDRLLVNRLPFYWSRPQRGDIVVFYPSHDPKTQFVKRCIGLPGEQVELKNGDVYINNQLLLLPGIHIKRDNADFGPVNVPEKHYFLLGDNRAFSADSRVWGFVEEEQIIGKAWFTFWPFYNMRILR